MVSFTFVSGGKGAPSFGSATMRSPTRISRPSIVPPVEAAAQGRWLDLVEGSQKKLDGPSAVFRGLRRRFRGNAVEFAAIARGEHQRLGKNAARTQLFRGQASVLARERNALAQLDRGGAVIQAYENNLHSLVSPSPGKSGGSLVRGGA